MQKNTTIIIAVLALAAGLIGGYMYASTGVSKISNKYEDISNMHMMPDGTMMGNSTHPMDTMSMADMMSSMNAQLQGKVGDQFDQVFLAEMIVHHQGAVEMAKLALTNAKHKEIRDLANAIIAAQNKEISDMKSWQKSWFGK